MFYQALYYFGFMPKVLQIIILIVIAITTIRYFTRAYSSDGPLFIPAILLTVSHICERLVRYFGNGTRRGTDFVIAIILLLCIGYILGKISNYSNMFVVSTLFVVVCCVTQNVLLMALMPIALLLQIVTAIKAVFRKNLRLFFMCIVVFFFALIKPSLGWIFNYAVTMVLVVIIVSFLNLNLVRTVIYASFAIVMTMVFSPWIAIESILIVEQAIRSVKSKNVLSFIMAMLANFFAFWVIGVIFSHNIIALVFVTILIIVTLKVLL